MNPHMKRWITGAVAVPIFLQGCAGNVNPNWIYDDPSRDPPPERVLPTALEPRLMETRRIGSILRPWSISAWWRRLSLTVPTS